jgi:hypothetical protein
VTAACGTGRPSAPTIWPVTIHGLPADVFEANVTTGHGLCGTEGSGPRPEPGDNACAAYTRTAAAGTAASMHTSLNRPASQPPAPALASDTVAADMAAIRPLTWARIDSTVGRTSCGDIGPAVVCWARTADNPPADTITPRRLSRSRNRSRPDDIRLRTARSLMPNSRAASTCV